MQKLAHGAVAHAELAGDLVVAAALELAQHERVALALGQRLHGIQRRAEVLAALEGLVGALDPVEVLVELLVGPAVLAQQVEGGVVGDAVEPGTQVEVGVLARHRLVGAEERLLDRVLGPAGRQQARAVREQGLAIALDDCLERRGMTRAYEIDEAIVALGAHESCAGEPGRLNQPLGRHVVPIG